MPHCSARNSPERASFRCPTNSAAPIFLGGERWRPPGLRADPPKTSRVLQRGWADYLCRAHQILAPTLELDSGVERVRHFATAAVSSDSRSGPWRRKMPMAPKNSAADSQRDPRAYGSWPGVEREEQPPDTIKEAERGHHPAATRAAPRATAPARARSPPAARPPWPRAAPPSRRASPARSASGLSSSATVTTTRASTTVTGSERHVMEVDRHLLDLPPARPSPSSTRPKMVNLPSRCGASPKRMANELRPESGSSPCAIDSTPAWCRSDASISSGRAPVGRHSARRSERLAPILDHAHLNLNLGCPRKIGTLS